jgi:sulfate adenylyltransferase
MRIPPYGGTLISRVVDEAQWKKVLAAASTHSVQLPDEDQINLFNLATGCYSPLTGFMTEQEYAEVLGRNKLPLGVDWTIPVLLRVDRILAGTLKIGDMVALHDQSQHTLAMLEVESIFSIDTEQYCAKVFGTTSSEHPGVQDCLRKPVTCLGGTIHLPASSIPSLRHFQSPVALRAWLDASGKETVTAFSTRNVCHLGHEYLHTLALEITDMLGINVITGAQVKGNFLSDVIFDTYEYLVEHYYPRNKVFLQNLRIPPIYAGPREAFLQATVLQNLGFTHFIVGRDHAGTGNYYGRYASQEIFRDLKDLDIKILPISEPRFCKVCRKITTDRSCRHAGTDVTLINGRDVRRFLLEKRYAELSNIVREDLQRYLTGLVEEHIDRSSHAPELELEKARQLFYN